MTYATSSGALPSCSGNNDDLYFIVQGVTASTGALAWVYPTNGVTTPDFSQFTLTYGFQDGGAGEYTPFVCVRYDTVTSTVVTAGPVYDIACADVGTTTIATYGTWVVNKPTNLYEATTTHVWYAQAYLFDSARALVATSSLVSFTLSGEWLSTPQGWVALTDTIPDFFDPLKYKIPFVYVFQFIDIINELTATASSSYSFSFGLEGMLSTSTVTVSSSTMGELLPTGTFDIVDEIGKWLVYANLAFMMYVLGRNMFSRHNVND